MCYTRDMGTRSARSITAEAAFRARLAELGATLLEPRWLGVHTPHRIRCGAGHECSPTPHTVLRGQGSGCRTCAGHDPAAAEAAFRARLAALGATLLEPRWLGRRAPHRVRCAAGHECSPRPDSLLRGQGSCRICARQDPATTEAAFRARLAELGATLLEPRYLGVHTPHRVRCAAGHECSPRPTSVLRGRGVCRVCARNDPAAAEAAFRARLAELGATLLEPRYLGVHTPHRARCAAGHECSPRPRDLLRGRGVCRTCSKRDPAITEAAFRARLAELGATLLEPRYLGVHTPHRARCAAGHECRPRPHDALKGDGICAVCAQRDPATVEAAFRARLAELGATLLEPRWLGVHTPHRIRCGAGHECSPTPHSVLRGHGVCRRCAGKEWDVFYVVADQAAGRIKFGITSGDPRPRLARHRASGYCTVVRLVVGLPSDTAPAMEQAVLAALRLADIAPLHGREHYDAAALALVLDVVDNYPLPPGSVAA